VRRLIVLSLVALSFPLGALIPAQAHGFEHCDERNRRVSELKRDHATCERARKVARRYDQRRIDSGQFPSEGNERIGRFTCHSERTGLETWKVKCRRGAEGDPLHLSRIRFNWGV
jgi:hypothetical protein